MRNPARFTVSNSKHQTPAQLLSSQHASHHFSHLFGHRSNVNARAHTVTRTSIRFAAAVTTIAVTLTACGLTSSTPGNGAPAVNGTYTTSLSDDPGSLSPLMTVNSTAMRMLSFAYDRLVYQDSTTGEFKAWLAEKWEETPTTVKFTLKPNITCQDGTAFTAQTVADNFNFVANPANKSPLRGAYVPGDARATANVAERTVTLTTPKPSPFMLANVANVFMVCDSVLKQPKSADAASQGTGLFTLKEAVANDHYTLKRRTGYTWGPGNTTSQTPGVPATVTLKIVANESTAANLLLAGALNAATVNGPDEDRLKALKLKSYTLSQPTGEMFFNQMPGKPTADPRVRQALTAALNLNDLTKIFTADKGSRTRQLAGMDPAGCTLDTTSALPAHSTQTAGQLLDQAGWRLGSNGKRSKDGKPLQLNLLYEILGDTTTVTAEYAQKEWAKLGVTVNLTGGNSTLVVGKLLSGTDTASWDITWEPVYVSVPSTIVPFLTGPSPADGTNFASIKNAAYEAGIAHAATLSGKAACDAWGTAETHLFTNADVVPFASQPNSTYFNKAALAITGLNAGPSVRVYQ